MKSFTSFVARGLKQIALKRFSLNPCYAIRTVFNSARSFSSPADLHAAEREIIKNKLQASFECGDFQGAIEQQKKLHTQLETTEKNTLALADSHNLLGMLHTKAGNLEQSLAHTQKVLEIYESLKVDREKLVSAIANLEINSFRLNKTDIMISQYEKLRSIYEKEGIACLSMGFGFNTYASYLQSQGKFDEAAQVSTNASGIFHKCNNPAQALHALHQAATIQHQGKNYKKAIPLYKQSLSYSIMNNVQLEGIAIDALYYLGDSLYKEGEEEKSVPFFQTCIKTFLQSKVEYQCADKSCQTLMEYYTKKGDTEKLNELKKTQEEVSKIAKQKELEVDLDKCYSDGLTAFEKGAFPEALLSFANALKECARIKKEDQILANILLLSGICKIRLAAHAEASELLEKALVYFDKLKTSIPAQASTLFYIAEASFRQHKFEEAIKQYESLLDYSSKNPIPPGAQLVMPYAKKNNLLEVIGYSYPRIGYCYRERGNNEKAAEYYARGVEKMKKTLGVKNTEIAILIAQYGEVLIRAEKNELALANFNESISILEEIKGSHQHIPLIIAEAALCAKQKKNNELAETLEGLAYKAAERLKGDDDYECIKKDIELTLKSPTE